MQWIVHSMNLSHPPALTPPELGTHVRLVQRRRDHRCNSARHRTTIVSAIDQNFARREFCYFLSVNESENTLFSRRFLSLSISHSPLWINRFIGQLHFGPAFDVLTQQFPAAFVGDGGGPFERNQLQNLRRPDFVTRFPVCVFGCAPDNVT